MSAPTHEELLEFVASGWCENYLPDAGETDRSVSVCDEGKLSDEWACLPCRARRARRARDAKAAEARSEGDGAT